MTMSIEPLFRPSFTLASSLAPTRREACAIADGQALEAIREGLEVLAREQRRRHHDRHLEAAHGGDEGCAQRDLRLAEADVAAHEAVHRAPGAEIGQHRFDAGVLVLGLLVREARDELVVGAFRRGNRGRLLQLAQGRDLDQLGRNLAQPLLEPRLARLPGDAAEPVELRARLVRAVAREQLDVLDGQEQLVAARVLDLEAVVGRAAAR